MEENYTDAKAKDKKLESVEKMGRGSQQICCSVKGTEVSVFSSCFHEKGQEMTS